MDFKLTNFNWTEIENLEADKKYYLQSRIFIERDEGGNTVYKYDVEFTKSASIPEGNGIVTSDILFTKSDEKKIYVRAMEALTNIHIEEIV